MKYVALLRGINVGGNKRMKMADLRDCLEGRDFTHVTTYIQSGNVLFESSRSDVAKLTTVMEKALSTTFHHDVPVFLRSQSQMQKIVRQAPKEWRAGKGLRQNVAFLRAPLTAKSALGRARPEAGRRFHQSRRRSGVHVNADVTARAKPVSQDRGNTDVRQPDDQKLQHVPEDPRPDGGRSVVGADWCRLLSAGSFVPECDLRIRVGGTTSGNVAGHERHDCQHERSDRQRQRIERAHAEQHALDERRQSERRRPTRRQRPPWPVSCHLATTRRMTSLPRAPNAIRMPISGVRSVTV